MSPDFPPDFPLKAEKEESRPTVKRKDRRIEILNVIEKRQPVSRKQIQEHIQMSAPTVLYWLRRLLKEEKIGITTASIKDRKAEYIIKKVKG